VKKAKKTYKAVKKHYGKHKRVYNAVGSGLATSADVAYKVFKMSQMLNAEKKRFAPTANAVSLGQCNGNGIGTYAYDFTPLPPSGSGYAQRSGSSIKMVSSYMRMKFWQQSACNTVMKIRVEMWKVTGPSVNAGTALGDLYNVSSMSGIVDYDSQPDPDYTGGIKKVVTRNFTLRQNFNSELGILDVAIPLKWNHHIRFNDDTQTCTDGQILLFVFCSAGNCSTTTASTLSNIPVSIINSGLVSNYDFMCYYYDN
jgi:hypothetical protein